MWAVDSLSVRSGVAVETVGAAVGAERAVGVEGVERDEAEDAEVTEWSEVRRGALCYERGETVALI